MDGTVRIGTIPITIRITNTKETNNRKKKEQNKKEKKKKA
jgi:hypothetical protein